MQSGLPGFGREHELYRHDEPTRSPRPYRFRSALLRQLYGTWAASDPRWSGLRARKAVDSDVEIHDAAVSRSGFSWSVVDGRGRRG
jgi:hypothetical protein